MGMLLQTYGFFSLFGDFIPVALRFGRSLPVIGLLLRLPVISGYVDRKVNEGRLPI
eukprot:NODE_12985_length_267_cov_13.871560_g12072_i0.p1 GENE.NODE_12985_length_267_cov_13.871560_g12072_i0~~NODE_12985_length_267_cov_13.871560_g12072_i0.p1  ORF type:complete len:63 (-),score=16.41 NODE_12985_length_267_cov_13.871560_g12072_i0:77-244(-)